MHASPRTCEKRPARTQLADRSPIKRTEHIRAYILSARGETAPRSFAADVLNLPRPQSAIRYGRRVICNSEAVDSLLHFEFSFYRKLQVHSSVTKTWSSLWSYTPSSPPRGRAEENALLGRLTGLFNPPRENSDLHGAIARFCGYLIHVGRYESSDRARR